MGVPKFFRYISERYPCLSELVKDYQIPEFDNLYLDMNGIIHTCSHPDDGDPHFRITEEKIFQDIFHYIEILFRMIKPQKLFFMAVDGVAPRAKMNQQRGRRFRSAREAQTLEEKARERGEVLPTEARFDSNCITPGTVFMARLHEQLKYFVVNKISTDKLWQKCTIILSGHETPGEGEHKIMDYIRYMRTQPGYDPNTRHCLYGLDADLMMLGLCTHEPHFSLLREEVKFGKKSNKRKNIPEQITFFLLHLSLMREYLELEFQPLQQSLLFEYDMEKVIDDWVLMGFLVGNDFIPHLPNLHITGGALPLLYNTYMKVLPKLGGYINESGILNLKRFEIFVKELGNVDFENFSENYADLKWFEGKTGRRLNDQSKPSLQHRILEEWEPDAEIPAILDEPLEPHGAKSDLAALIKATNDIILEPSSQDNAFESESEIDIAALDNDEDLFNAEFIQHKTDYYMNKLDYANVTEDVLRSQTEEYVRAIQWNLHYYYNGVCSWSWYYPHHYAPYVSDIKKFSDLTFNFELGIPFQPYEQLLAVLPSASKSFLPAPYQELMVNDDSPIKHYYPDDFKTDLNGKKQEWEAVVLIPFIDENVLLKAMEPCKAHLTSEEIRRNLHGPMFVYRYTSDAMGLYEAPQYFPPVQESHASTKAVEIKDIRVPIDLLIKGAFPGAKFDVYYPGFPTLKHLQYQGFLDKCKVKVFEQPSKGENMILRIIEPIDVDESPVEGVEKELDAVAKELLGKTVHVSWPYLIEALVIAVSNRQYKYFSAGEKGQYNVEEHKGSLWKTQKQGIVEHYQNRLGIDVGIVDVLVHVKVMIGRKYVFTSVGRVTLEKQWSDLPSVYPLQTVVKDIAAYETKYTAYKDIGQVFPAGSQCFMLGQPGYGAMAEVLDCPQTIKDGRIKISLKKFEEPDLTAVMQMENDIKIRFMNLHVAATKLAISKNLFSRITGSVFVAPGGRTQMDSDDVPKVNIGLNLKFNKKNQEIPGYSRKEGNTWLYSNKTIALVSAYMENFPHIFQYLNYNSGNLVVYEEELFKEGNAKEMLKNITTWIKKQPFSSVEPQVCGSIVLDPDSVKLMEKITEEHHNSKNSKVKQMIIKVKPQLLYKPDIQMGNLMPDSAAVFQLFDRIVNVREGYTVPLGLKGTIIGLYQSSTLIEKDMLYDVSFDQPFPGGVALNCSLNRGYRMPRAAIINISHGQRVYEEKTGKSGQHSQTNQIPPLMNPNSLFSQSLGNYQQTHFHPQIVQRNQNHNSPHKNYPPPLMNAKGNYTPPSFQPQAPLGNWSQGCSYPIRPPIIPPPIVPPPNFNQYGYNNFPPNFVPPTYNSNYYNSPGGPNTFVPYKTNSFPPPPVPIGYEPKNGPGIAPQHHPGGGEVRILQKGAKKLDRESESKEAFSKTVIREKVTEMDKLQDQVSNANSEFLKRMLKINENANSLVPGKNTQDKPKPKESNKKQNQSSSVDDFFARARSNNKDKNVSFSSAAQLLKEYQTRNLGCPNYQYFEVGGKFNGKITLPNGTNVMGDLLGTKEEAAENVATKALSFFQNNNNTEQITTKLPLDVVPDRSTRKEQQRQSASSPQKRGQTTMQVNWREQCRKETVDVPRVDKRRTFKIDTDHIHKHLNLPTANDNENGANMNKSKPTSTFVPLQAVRQQQRNRTNSSSNTGGSKAKPDDGSKRTEMQERVEMLQPEVAEVKSAVKPRRERKIRIAANFQTAMTNK